jgi:hypothetical protein
VTAAEAGRLTQSLDASTLTEMGFEQHILAAVLTVALAAYAFDCAPMATAQQAMQCCKSMQCMRHGHHTRDCCKEMPSTRAVVGQPSTVNHSFAPFVVGTVQPYDESFSHTTSERLVAGQSHSPPIFSLPAVLPLRI